MNKTILASFTILCLLSVPLIMKGNICVKAGSRTWYVDDSNVSGPWNGTKEHPCQNITDALEHAVDGDAVFVFNGTYCENIEVGKSVSLIGEHRDLTIVDGNGTGSVISIKEEGNVKIRGFTIKGSGTFTRNSGILVEMCHGNEISHNRITNNKDGIRFELSRDNVISDNIISSNNNDGILLNAPTSLVSRNTITNNDNGIHLYWSWDNVISGNIISSNNNGISLASTSRGNISGNIISSNNNGISLDIDSGDNTIYHNNFNNAYQVQSESTNSWDYDNEGNYWCDYNGTDDNQDGVGETPYIIDEKNKDNYPLAGMFSDFSFTSDGETYHVYVISNSTISDFGLEIGHETGSKILRFNATGEASTVGFCRVMIPIKLMNYSCIVLVGVEEIFPTKLNVTSETYDYLYFTYIQNSRTITIISSKTLYLYYELLDDYGELLDKYIKLETDLYDLNATYQELLNNYTDFLANYNIFLINYSELQESHQQLNNSYEQLLSNYTDFLIDYSIFLSDYSELQKSHQQLNNSYCDFLINYSTVLTSYSELQKSHQEFLNNYTIFLSDYNVFLINYGELQESHQELNNSYQELLLDYSKKIDNIQNLTYIFAATTAIFIITTIYLSRSAHAGKSKVFEDTEKERTP